jgi:signal peptidase I
MHTDQALIKRVIAVAGDTVQVKGGQLYINGVQQEENYVFEEPGTPCSYY